MDTPTPETPQVQTTPEPVVTPRQEVYNKYDSLYQTPPAPVETPAPAEPAPPVEPEAPQGPSEVQLLQERLALQESQLNDLRAKLQPAPTPVTPEPAKPHYYNQWMELIRDGKIEEAEALFAENLIPRLAEQLKPQLIQQSVEANRAEQEIERFVQKFEAENTDLLDFRDYIVEGAEKRLMAARNEGRIKTASDLTAEYTKAVTEETARLRKILQSTRSAGAAAAMTSKTNVLSATTMSPSPISAPEQPAPTPTAPTALDYIQMRQNRINTARGLSN